MNGPRSLLQRHRARFDAAAEAWADTHVRLSPRQRRDLSIVLAAPYQIQKSARGRKWMAVRWFYNLKVGEAKWHLLLALRKPPRTSDTLDVEHAFLVPRAALGTRKVLAYYDTEADRRGEPFLDRYRIEPKQEAA